LLVKQPQCDECKKGKNRYAIFTFFRHLRRALRGANGYIEFTLKQGMRSRNSSICLDDRYKILKTDKK